MGLTGEAGLENSELLSKHCPFEKIVLLEEVEGELACESKSTLVMAENPTVTLIAVASRSA